MYSSVVPHNHLFLSYLEAYICTESQRSFIAFSLQEHAMLFAQECIISACKIYCIHYVDKVVKCNPADDPSVNLALN